MDIMVITNLPPKTVCPLFCPDSNAKVSELQKLFADFYRFV